MIFVKLQILISETCIKYRISSKNYPDHHIIAKKLSNTEHNKPPTRLKSFGLCDRSCRKFSIVLLKYDFGMDSADSMNSVDLLQKLYTSFEGKIFTEMFRGGILYGGPKTEKPQQIGMESENRT